MISVFLFLVVLSQIIGVLPSDERLLWLLSVLIYNTAFVKSSAILSIYPFIHPVLSGLVIYLLSKLSVYCWVSPPACFRELPWRHSHHMPESPLWAPLDLQSSSFTLNSLQIFYFIYSNNNDITNYVVQRLSIRFSAYKG